MDEHTKALAATAACWLLIAGTASAAGGHHAVDDAAILPPGGCELEAWFTTGPGERLLHAGGGCRLGPIELGVAGELGRSGGASATVWTVQGKWAAEVADGVGFGLSVQPVLLPRQRPRYAGTTLAALATWSPRDDLAFHVNIGRDFVNRGPDTPRSGIAAEWAPVARWWLLAERYVADSTHSVRVGVRWATGANWSVDFSRAHRLSGPEPSNWTLGLSFEFGGKD